MSVPLDPEIDTQILTLLAAVTFEAPSVAVREALDEASLADVQAFSCEVGCWRQYF